MLQFFPLATASQRDNKPIMASNERLISEQYSPMLPLEHYMDNASIALECITIRREIEKTKERRITNKKRHHEARKHYEKRLSSEVFHMERIIQGRNLPAKYTDAVKCLYHIMPAPYVLRKHAELIQNVRNQELLETYIRLREQHNEELVQYLEWKRMNLIKGLFIQEDRIHLVKEQIIQLVAQKVANLFYKQRRHLSLSPYSYQDEKKDHSNTEYQPTYSIQAPLMYNEFWTDEYQTSTSLRKEVILGY